MSERDSSSDRLPEELEKALRDLYTPAGRAGGIGRDAAILAAARRAGASGTRRWRWAVGSGLAAAVALAATLWWALPHRQEGQGGSVAAAAYVRTGDIRDAFYVARQITSAGETSGKALEAWDVNHDGRVDGADVELLALAAVRIEKGATP